MQTLLLRSLLILCVSCFSLLAKGQDARFAQFYAAPLELNPAMLGVFEGQFRFVANYRSLYSSILDNRPYRTISASFDMRHRIMSGDYFALGFSAQRDDAGLSRFNHTQVNLGGSFLKQLGGSGYRASDQYLVAGAQVGLGQRGLTYDQLWFSQQFRTGPNTAFIDTEADNGESFSEDNTGLYLDFNAGLLWYATFDKNASIYLGGAMYHINSPNVATLVDGDAKLYSRWVVHGGGELPMGDNLSLLPAVLVMKQGPSFSTNAGANFRYTRRDWQELALRAGLWAHLSNQGESMGVDAVIFAAILELERWNLGFSYDITTSTLATSNNSRGAFEISMIYTHREKSRYRINCPKF
ncbi:MAG: hypothetical protein DHS20C18_44150 [Saprospiraceae bacterium]|nr:MAG: hypothetical protein DHS20C18_44150 [Saprospiraceae bacterium]